jgi:hypothetical protein
MSSAGGVLVAGDGERRELPSFRPGPSAARGHAGRITRRYDIAGQPSIHDFAVSLPYERGYIAVGDDGQLIFSDAIEASEHARAYAVQHLKGKSFGRPMTGRTDYFTWHRENKFLDAV